MSPPCASQVNLFLFDQYIQNFHSHQLGPFISTASPFISTAGPYPSTAGRFPSTARAVG
jgi:hypothetical protein